MRNVRILPRSLFIGSFRLFLQAHLDKVHAAAQRKVGKRHLLLRREFGQIESAAKINDLIMQLKEVEETMTPDSEHLNALSKKMEDAIMS